MSLKSNDRNAYKNGRAKVVRNDLSLCTLGLQNNNKLKVTEMREKNFCFTFVERPPICSFTLSNVRKAISPPDILNLVESSNFY
jgi:hypothetical protein